MKNLPVFFLLLFVLSAAPWGAVAQTSTWPFKPGTEVYGVNLFDSQINPHWGAEVGDCYRLMFYAGRNAGECTRVCLVVEYTCEVPGWYTGLQKELFQISFDGGATWEPIEEYGANFGFDTHGLVGMMEFTNLSYRHSNFQIKHIRYYPITGSYHYEYAVDAFAGSYSPNAPDNYFEMFNGVAKFGQKEYVLQSSDQQIEIKLNSHRFRTRTFPPGNARLDRNDLSSETDTDMPVLYWEIAETTETGAWHWKKIEETGMSLTLSDLPRRSQGYRLAVRPRLADCYGQYVYPDTAYVDVPALSGSGRTLADRDAVCPDETIRFSVAEASGPVVGWAVTVQPEASELERWRAVSPNALVTAHVFEATDTVFEFQWSRAMMDGSFARRFRALYGVDPQIQVAALVQTAEGVYITDPTAVRLKTLSVGGRALPSAQLCRGVAPERAINLEDHQGQVLYWESSADRVNWDRIDHTTPRLQMPALEQSAWFRARVQGECQDEAVSEAAMMEVFDGPQSGNLSILAGDASICWQAEFPIVMVEGHRGRIAGWQVVPEGSTDTLNIPSTASVLKLSPAMMGPANLMQVSAWVELEGCGRERTNWLSVSKTLPRVSSLYALDVYTAGMYHPPCPNGLRTVSALGIGNGDSFSLNRVSPTLYGWEVARHRRLDSLQLFLHGFRNVEGIEWKPVVSGTIGSGPTQRANYNTEFWISAIDPFLEGAAEGDYVAVRMLMADSTFEDCPPIASAPVVFRTEGCKKASPPECRAYINVPFGQIGPCYGTALDVSISNRPADAEVWLESSPASDFTAQPFTSVPCSDGCQTPPMTEPLHFRLRLEYQNPARTEYIYARYIQIEPPVRSGGLTQDYLTVCEGQSSGPIRISGEHGRVVEWQTSTDSSVWTAVPNTGGLKSFSTVALNQDTWVRARVFSCDSAVHTAPVRVQVIAAPNGKPAAPEIVGGAICVGLPVRLRLTDPDLIPLAWLISTNGGQTFGSFGSPGMEALTNNIFGSALVKVRVLAGGCGLQETEAATITPLTTPSWPTNLMREYRACSGASLTVNFPISNIESAPWVYSLDNGATWLDAPAGGDESSWTIDNAQQPMLITRRVEHPCLAQTSVPVIQVSIQSAGMSRVNGPARVCIADGTQRFTAVGAFHPADLVWEARRDTAAWRVTARGTPEFATGFIGPGVLDIRVGVTVEGCPTRYSDVFQVTILGEDAQALISGPRTLCSADRVWLTAGGFEGQIVEWQTRRDNCSPSLEWKKIDHTRDSLAVEGLESGVHCYRVVTRLHPECAATIGRPFELKANPSPGMMALATLSDSYCAGDSPSPIFLIGETDADIYWQYSHDQETWSDLFEQTQRVLTPPRREPATWYRAVLWTPDCGSIRTESVPVYFMTPYAQISASSAKLCPGVNRLTFQSLTNSETIQWYVDAGTGFGTQNFYRGHMLTYNFDADRAERLRVYLEYRCGSAFYSSDTLTLASPALIQTAPTAAPSRVCPLDGRSVLSIEEATHRLTGWQSSVDGFQSILQSWTGDANPLAVAGINRSVSVRAVFAVDGCTAARYSPAVNLTVTPSACRDLQNGCDTPTEFQIVSTGTRTAEVRWTPVGGSVRRYVIEIKPNTPAATTWIAFTVMNPADSRFVLTGLRPGTEYVMRIKARCVGANESDYAPWLTFNTLIERQGIDSEVEERQTAVYPNPNRGQFNLRYWSEEALEARVYDMTGRTVWSFSLPPAVDTNDFPVSLDGQPSGMYFLELRSASRREAVKVIVE